MARRNAGARDGIIRTAWRASYSGIIVVVIFSAVINLLRFATPLYLLQVLDRVPASRSVETLIMLTAITLFAVICGFGLEIVRRWMLTRWGVWIENEIGPAVVRQGLSATDGNAGDIDAELGHLARIRLFVSKAASSWLDIIWVPFYFIAVLLMHPLLGAIAILAVVVLVSLAALEHWATREPRRLSGDAGRRAGDILATAVRNRESAVAHSMAANLTERWRLAATNQLAERERLEARKYLFRVSARRIGDLLWILMIAIGVWLFLSGDLTMGAIFAARVTAGFAYRLVERAVRDIRPLEDAYLGYKALNAYLSVKAQNSTLIAAGTTNASVTFDAVSFKFPGERDYVVRPLSLELSQGEMLLVTGAAATGKTTLCRLLVGRLAPRHGQIRFGDLDIQRLPHDLRGSMIGYLPQHTELFEGTIAENIARMGSFSPEQVTEASRLVGIHDLIVRLPAGYDTVIGPEVVGTFSGSVRKRIAIARAFFECPRLIVLDEPNANLDGASRRIVEAAIRHLKQQGCIIVVTQGIRSAQFGELADKFLILGGKSPELRHADDDSKKSTGRAELRSVT